MSSSSSSSSSSYSSSAFVGQETLEQCIYAFAVHSDFDPAAMLATFPDFRCCRVPHDKSTGVRSRDGKKLYEAKDEELAWHSKTTVKPVAYYSLANEPQPTYLLQCGICSKPTSTEAGKEAQIVSDVLRSSRLSLGLTMDSARQICREAHQRCTSKTDLEEKETDAVGMQKARYMWIEYLVAAFDLSELRRQQMVHNVASLCETKFDPDLQDFFDACKNKVPVLENMINPRASIVDKVCKRICPEHHEVGDLVCYRLPRMYESCGICLKPRRAARPAASKERVPQSALFDSVSTGDQQANKNGR
jgi:hypothetical protein